MKDNLKNISKSKTPKQHRTFRIPGMPLVLAVHSRKRTLDLEGTFQGHQRKTPSLLRSCQLEDPQDEMGRQR